MEREVSDIFYSKYNLPAYAMFAVIYVKLVGELDESHWYRHNASFSSNIS